MEKISAQTKTQRRLSTSLEPQQLDEISRGFRMGRTAIRRTLRILLFATLAAGLLRTPRQAAALPNRESCVRWEIVSYDTNWVVVPSGLLIEYYVTFTDGRLLRFKHPRVTLAFSERTRDICASYMHITLLLQSSVCPYRSQMAGTDYSHMRELATRRLLHRMSSPRRVQGAEFDCLLFSREG